MAVSHPRVDHVFCSAAEAFLRALQPFRGEEPSVAWFGWRYCALRPHTQRSEPCRDGGVGWGGWGPTARRGSPPQEPGKKRTAAPKRLKPQHGDGWTGDSQTAPKKEVVKRTDTPDFVHSGCPERDRHSSGPGVTHPARCYLPASSAEPHQCWPIWYCCAQRLPVSPGLNRLVSVALILTLGPLQGCRWRGVTSCAVLCSPDVPPVRPFGP